MRISAWIAALLLATALPAAVRAENCKCDCPCAHHRKHRTISHAAPKTAPTPKIKRVASHPIAGGPTAAKAVPIEFDRIYKISHSVKKDAKDYFSVPLEPGMEMTLAMKTLKKEDAGVEVFDTKSQSVASLTLTGEANQVQRVSVKPLRSGRYVIAVAGGQGLAANQVIFQATTGTATVDCAANAEGGGMLGAEEPLQDCFWDANVSDTFHFDGKRKESYRIEVVSPEAATDLKVSVALERKKKSPQVLTEISGSGGRVAVESIVLPAKGSYAVQVGVAQTTPDVIPYSVTLTKLSGN